MPKISTIISARQKQRNANRKRPQLWIGFGCALVFSISLLIGGLSLSGAYLLLSQEIPPTAILPDLLSPPAGILLEPTRLYDRSGKHTLLTLSNPGIDHREYLTLDSLEGNYIPSSLVTATLTVADPYFWNHPGFNLSSFGYGSDSTLAQSLVSEYLLWDTPSGFKRDFLERILAAQITAQYGREKIFTWYLNHANYGRFTFGAEAAAQVYFGKPTAELTLAEAALLAAVSESPAYNPHDSLSAALDRQQAVIQAMLGQGRITREQAQEALNEAVEIRPPQKPPQNLAPAFSNYVLKRISEDIPIARLERGGIDIITSLDYDLQQETFCATEAHIAKLSGNDTYPSEGCETALLLPTISHSPEQAVGDISGSVIIYDPKSGEILAMVGEAQPGIDPTETTNQPTGTLLTPFLYLTALTRGSSPATLLWDIPVDGYTEPNTNHDFVGPVRLRTALTNDYLSPAYQLLQQVGTNSVQQTFNQMGLEFGIELGEHSNQIFWDRSVSLLQTVQAYGVLANSGIGVGVAAEPRAENGTHQYAPVAVLSIEDRSTDLFDPTSGKHIEYRSDSRTIINPQLAYLITDMLSDESVRWPSLGHPNPYEIGRPVAIKDGRTPDGSAYWSIGYTPQRVIGTWIGPKNPTASEKDILLPEQASAGLWHAVSKYVLRHLPANRWEQPTGISQTDVCIPSGMLPSADCPNIVREVFLAGSEPTQIDTLYKRLEINRETGQLATALTPPELIDSQVFLVVPPAAAQWAEVSGLPTPPETYDVISAPVTKSPDVRIASPEMLSQISGGIVISGTAAGDSFEYYRLHVGQGLNPTSWLQIGENHSTPVKEGVLGEWNTGDLNGLFTIQLMVVDEQQLVESDFIQVTVDNLAPNVTIHYPNQNQELTLSSDYIIFQTIIVDNSIERADFYLDDELIGSLRSEPYSFPWTPDLGSHTLEVIALDRAGNIERAVVEFSVIPGGNSP